MAIRLGLASEPVARFAMCVGRNLMFSSSSSDHVPELHSYISMPRQAVLKAGQIQKLGLTLPTACHKPRCC